MQWNTILSFPIKWINSVSGFFQYFSQSLLLASAHSFVDEIYPIGASNQTYKTFPSAPFIGTDTPQSKSLVTALGFKPSSNHDLHCPYTLSFQSDLFFIKIQSSKNDWNSSNFRYQCLVSFKEGVFPVIDDFGSIRSIALWLVPHFSHWSPYDLSWSHLGHVPTTNLSGKNCFASSSKNCSLVISLKKLLLWRFIKKSEAVLWWTLADVLE